MFRPRAERPFRKPCRLLYLAARTRFSLRPARPRRMASPPSDQTFQALIGERTFDIAFEDGTLMVDGERVEYAFDRIGEDYFALRLDGRSVPVVIELEGGGHVRVTIAGRQRTVRVKDEQDLLLERFGLDEGLAAADAEVHAPMPGLVLKVMVEEGQDVAEGEGLLVLEAMKMENELTAPAAGTVEAVHVGEGDAVGKNDLLVTFAA